jgi:hypothetical protein
MEAALMVAPALIVRFILSLAVGIFAAFGVGALATPSQPRSEINAAPVGDSSALPSASAPASATEPPPIALPSPGGPVPSIQLAGDDGNPVAFDVGPSNPPAQPAKPLPPNGTIRLTIATAWIGGGGDQSVSKPPWWNANPPRIPAITQFDGGPFQGANCTLASGSMLARLAFGVVTTGSQLRGLQDDRDGGTSLYDLNTALNRGWGVGFTIGSVSPVQFRALIYGGAGAVLAGNYGQIPFSLRLQKNFTGGHAIYIDAFRPPSAAGPAAYFVIDPIGRPWRGYEGEWWPADVIESFATSLGGGRMFSAWAFAGGSTPSKHPILPPEAYPGASGGPGSSGAPGPSQAAPDPMPTGPVEQPPDVDPGTIDPPQVEQPTGGSVETGGAEIQVDPSFCAQSPRPANCPPGLVATVTGASEPPSTGTSGGGTTTGSGPAPPAGGPPAGGPPGGPGPPAVKPLLLWATLIATGTYQLVYSADPASAVDIWLWSSSTSPTGLLRVRADAATLLGAPVSVATVTVDPTTSYSFVASSSAPTGRALSILGSILGGH